MSSYSGDLSPSDRADLAEFEDARRGCRHCGGLGYIPKRGEAMAADPCGCADEVEEDDE
jgi:hypothetical protein